MSAVGDARKILHPEPTDSPLNDLIERLEDASDTLRGLAQRPTVTLLERNRLNAKAEGVRLALSYAREHARSAS